MKKMRILITGIILVSGFSLINAQTSSEPVQAGSSVVNYSDSKTVIQANYDEMYRALPQDIQEKVRCAAMTIENIRMKPPLESQNYITAERARAEEFMKTTISQMPLSEMLKVQVDDARTQVNAQINERMNELKARRASHR